MALSLVAIAACRSGAAAQNLSGSYGGTGTCSSYIFTFRAKGVAYVKTLYEGKVTRETPGEYAVGDDKVSVKAGMSLVFTRKGNALETPLGQTNLVCTKLSDVGVAVALAHIVDKCDTSEPDSCSNEPA